MKNILNYLDKNLEKFALTSLYIMIFVTILAEVIQRFVLSYSTSWGEEIARYSFIYLVWIAASLCVKERIHLKIDLITNMLSNRGQAVLLMLGEVVTLLLAILCIWLSMHSVLLSFKFESVTDGLRVIKGIFLFAVPFGFSIMFIRIIQNILKDIKSYKQNLAPIHKGSIFKGQ